MIELFVGRGRAGLLLALGFVGCFDRAPTGLGPTPSGPGATVRFDLGHQPLPEIPLPNDTATWPDPTSRTGLRINASLVAPTRMEAQARARFSQMEGWGTFAPLTVAFDLPEGGAYEGYRGPALDLANLRARHQGDDFDFDNDAIYLVDLETGTPQVLDLGSGSFDYTLERLDRYWPNDPHETERNLLFETLDETDGGRETRYRPELDRDFDGVLDVPNLLVPHGCPAPDPICDDTTAADYGSEACRATRHERDRCIADDLLTFYERETDTLILRPLLPLREMSRYAVVITDRVIDGLGNAVKSPFGQIYHPSQAADAARVGRILDDPEHDAYFGDLAGTGLTHVAFLWSFTTQPTVDDLRRLRDGLYGQGPFAGFAERYPAELEVQRMVGLRAGLADGVTDEPSWADSVEGKAAACPQKADNLWVIDYEGLRDAMKALVSEGFGLGQGPDAQELLRQLDHVSHLVVATFQTPFLIEGGPEGRNPDAAFDADFQTGEAVETSDTVQVWMIIPKETEEHQQPFDVNVFGHGYTGNFLEPILYAGNLAAQGLATVGINAMGHGLVLGPAETLGAKATLAGACYGPAFDALTAGRARDLDRDGEPDSGGDFWSSYLFHTRDAVRQSVLDHLQLVRILRTFGEPGGMTCRDDAASPAVVPCDPDGDGSPSLAGDFDGDGRPDLGGTKARYGTWGESLGGILSGIGGALDPHVAAAVPGSGGGGLTDIGLRSFQGGVIEAVLLRLWGPLVTAVPAASRGACTAQSDPSSSCTLCSESQVSLRWVMPDVNGTGEMEIACLEPEEIAGTTVVVRNGATKDAFCARANDEGAARVGIAASIGDPIAIELWQGEVASYDGCGLRDGASLLQGIDSWQVGRYGEGTPNGDDSAECGAERCAAFQGRFYPVGSPLVAPAEGLGLGRQTPALRRFLGLAQAALEPGDPIAFARHYALDPLPLPNGQPGPPHAVLTLNTIGDQNVPLSTGIAFARATGALPFLRPDQAERYPAYADYATPAALYEALGDRTPNQALIDGHVIEGISALSRHPAGPECATSANAAPLDATFLDADGQALACFAEGCSEATESDPATRLCFSGQQCDLAAGRCVPRPLGATTCEEALFDADDLDEGRQQYFEQAAAVPHRLARLPTSVSSASLEAVWAPRLSGVPGASDDDAYTPLPGVEGRLVALLDAYTVPEGEHTFVNGNPCQSFDHGTYLTRLVGRFFASGGSDLYYLSHPSSHHCLEDTSCP
ncbi:MAG: hypothetical protein R3B72_02850 [Polyangiaceae bacterium]